ncbi:MAG: hypothetical protein J0I41_07535 [Filimonas sp.]|nr:hypothetical protein [Filimonas sp.]
MQINYKKIATYLVVLLVIINLPPIAAPLRTIIDDNQFRYSNADGSYTIQEHFFKARLMREPYTNKVHQDFIKRYPGTTDTIIYRLYWRNPLCFWRWGYYLFDKRYSTFQYKNWDKIKEVRDKKEASGIKLSEDWMDF